MQCFFCFLVLMVNVVFLAHAGGGLLAPERSQLEGRGLSIEAVSTQDYVSVVKGGLIRKDSWVGLTELMLTWETAKSGLWHGGKFFVHGTSTNGHLKPTGEMVGDIQAVNGNEAGRSVRLFEFWYEQSLLEDRLSALVGLHDINSEFMASDSAGLYINGAFGVTTTMSANVPTSAYPLAAPAVRVKWVPDERWEILAGIYDGDPGNSTVNTHSTHLAVKSQDGLMSISQMGYGYELPLAKGLQGALRVGAWHHSKDFNDVVSVDANGDPLRHDDNYGAYVYVDQALYKEKEGQGLNLFFIGSGAPQNRNAVDRHYGGGLNYVGLVPGRDADQAGIAMTQSRFGKKTRESSGQEPKETTLEATYRMVINDSVAIQPDFQYVINPNGDAAIKNTSVVTLRTEIVF